MKQTKLNSRALVALTALLCSPGIYAAVERISADYASLGQARNAG